MLQDPPMMRVNRETSPPEGGMNAALSGAVCPNLGRELQPVKNAERF